MYVELLNNLLVNRYMMEKRADKKSELEYLVDMEANHPAEALKYGLPRAITGSGVGIGAGIGVDKLLRKFTRVDGLNRLLAVLGTYGLTSEGTMAGMRKLIPSPSERRQEALDSIIEQVKNNPFK